MKYAFDLHLHSCLSPCGGEDNTPANLAGMCALAGLQIVALTDHNTMGNCAAFCKAAEENGLLALPGMELTTLEEAHVVCLFADLDGAAAFGELVRRRLPPMDNDPAVFGPQILMDEADNVLGEERALLAGATDLGIYDVAALVRSYGGVAYPAHIDRPSFSLLSNLGLWDPDMGFPLAEASPNCPPDLFDRPDLRGVRHITACDAHYLDQIPDAHQFMELDALTAQDVLRWLIL
jgi:PHP family Zn ribbon phosphoesterase